MNCLMGWEWSDTIDNPVVCTSSANRALIESSLQCELASIQNGFSPSELLVNKYKFCVVLFGGRPDLGVSASPKISFNDGSSL